MLINFVDLKRPYKIKAVCEPVATVFKKIIL